jgi:hypothetical protein
MPFDKQKGGERTDGKGSEVKFVRLDGSYNHQITQIFTRLFINLPNNFFTFGRNLD